MSKEEFIEKIKEINTNVPNEEFFLEYNRVIYNILDENERLKEENFKLQARADKYKCRIDKAIEYLETATIDPQSMLHYRGCLLEILKGEE